MISTRKVFVISAVLVFTFMPVIVFAAPSWLPLVQCGKAVPAGQIPVPCTPCDIFGLGSRIVDMVLYGITGPVAAFMIVIAGGMMLLGGASPKQFQQGKTILKDTLIGVTIILIAWMFTNFLIKSLGTGMPTAPWNTFTCPAELQAVSAIETQFKTGGTLPAIPAPVVQPPVVQPPSSDTQAPVGEPDSPKVAVQPVNVGKVCKGTLQSLCGTTDIAGATWQCSDCGTVKADGKTPLSSYFSKYGGQFGVSSKLLNAIAFVESTCNPTTKPSKAGAYGLMQMLPGSAAPFGPACDVYQRETEGPKKGDYTMVDGKKVPIAINAGFLSTPSNANFIVCLAAAYLHANKGKCPSDRDLAASYNSNVRWCQNSNSCTGELSCAGGPKKAWECPWENRAHTQCNDNPAKNLIETRNYAPHVVYCASH